MINLKTRITSSLPSAAEFNKQTRFGTAKGLTETAKEGQAAVVGALKGAFTLRGQWFQANMRHGIKITPATKLKLQSEVKTAADWLEPHETGEDRKAKGRRLAVALWGARPKGSRKILSTVLRPKALLRAGKAFILDTHRGEIIATLKADRIVPLFGLEDKVAIKKQSTFYEPLKKLVYRRLIQNVQDGIDFALKTARRP
jgi:hypothetical protein